MTFALLLGLVRCAASEEAPLAGDAPTAGAGDLIAHRKDGTPLGICPLKHTDVATEISGFVARVVVTQTFANPFTDPIEAIYTFPLSDRAAVDGMTMKTGERVIRGEIKRREDARRIYEAARAAGKLTSLLDQERPNIFTQSLANVMPGAEVEVRLEYVEPLKFADGTFEFSFPTVVGPRFVPGTPTGHGGTGFTQGDFQCNVRFRVVTETQESTTSQTSGFSQISVNIWYPSATGNYAAGGHPIVQDPIITYWDEGDWTAGNDPDPMCSGTKWFRTKAVFRDEAHGDVLITTSFSTAATC